MADNKGYPSEGVHSFAEVTGERDREIVRLYEGTDMNTEQVGKQLGISGVRVCQRLDHWFALGVDLPKWKERRLHKEGDRR